MFKGKKSIYILLPLNLLIWGYMGYKIYAAFNEDDSGMASESVAPPVKLKTNDSVAYKLSFNYRDPFLKEEPARGRNYNYDNDNAARPQAPVQLVTQVSNRSLVQPPKEKTGLDIKYLGLIENKSSGATSAMVMVNGISQVVKPGQTIDDMQFQSITPEFIVVKVGKEKITVRK